jgi:hypothetical protein
MKRITAFLFTVLIATTILAQSPVVTKRYSLPDDAGARFHPVFNASGDKLLHTVSGYAGLSLYDLNSQKTITISNDAGSGYEPVFGNNDNRIFFRRTTFENGRKSDAIAAYNLPDNSTIPMISPRRDVRQVNAFENGFLVSADEKVMKVTFGKTSNDNLLYVTTENLKIVLYDRNIKKILNPAGVTEPRYIWVSLSPDKQKILYTAAGQGTFVCDLNGKIIAKLGYLNAPVWYNNVWVVGMNDRDDGHRLLSSEIMMKHLYSSNVARLSEPGEKAMYPTTAQGKVAWHTEEGKIQIVELSVR